MVRRPSRLAALSPPIPRLPPGAGNQADKLEEYDLELAKKGYLYAVGQSNRHAPAVAADRKSGELALSVCLTHLSRRLLPAETWVDSTRSAAALSSTAVGLAMR